MFLKQIFLDFVNVIALNICTTMPGRRNKLKYCAPVWCAGFPIKIKSILVAIILGAKKHHKREEENIKKEMMNLYAASFES